MKTFKKPSDFFLNILGQEYSVKIKTKDEEPEFEKQNIVGYCDHYLKEIVIQDLSTDPSWDGNPEQTKLRGMLETARHEIVHAYLSESGLCASSFAYDGGWAKNEEMVDWIAIQGEKIHDSFRFAEMQFECHE